MTGGLADTSIFIAREDGRPLDESVIPDELAISVITVGELCAGVLAAPDLHTRDTRLRTLTAVLALDSIPVDNPVADARAHLRILLREAGQKMPVNDSWIAATAIALGVPVVTQDTAYDLVPDLEVILV